MWWEGLWYWDGDGALAFAGDGDGRWDGEGAEVFAFSHERFFPRADLVSEGHCQQAFDEGERGEVPTGYLRTFP